MLDLEAVIKRYKWLSEPISITPMTDTGLNNHLWKVQAGADAYILKQHTSTSYEDGRSFAYETAILNRLQSFLLSFALPVPYLTPWGARVWVKKSGFSLSPYLPGERMSPSDLSQVRAMGQALGELQAGLVNIPVVSRPGRPLFELLFDFSAIDVCTLSAADLGLTENADLNEVLAWWRQEATILKTFAETRYRSLPWRICHNDITPNNVLITDHHVSAVLDFEFMSPAARALDVAMALRTTMRIWENPEPWPVIEHFFEPYRTWIQLTNEEIEALPLLLRLRTALPVVWWVGRQQKLERIPFLIENLRTMTTWLDQYEDQFLERVRQSCRPAH